MTKKELANNASESKSELTAFDPSQPLAMHYTHDKHWRIYERAQYLMVKYTDGAYLTLVHSGFAVMGSNGSFKCVIEPKDLTSIDARFQNKLDSMAAEARIADGSLDPNDADDYVAHLALMRKFGTSV